MTASRSAIVHGVIAAEPIDSGGHGVMPDSAGATALVFLSDTIFASGDANGLIKVWGIAGMELYGLPKLPGPISALESDGLSVTANFPTGARRFTVEKKWIA